MRRHFLKDNSLWGMEQNKSSIKSPEHAKMSLRFGSKESIQSSLNSVGIDSVIQSFNRSHLNTCFSASARAHEKDLGHVGNLGILKVGIDGSSGARDPTGYQQES